MKLDTCAATVVNTFWLIGSLAPLLLLLLWFSQSLP
jgi:hypothetical protein